MIPRRGELVTTRLDPAEGSEQRGARPAVVISADEVNTNLEIATIVPLATYRGGRIFPSEAVIPAADTGLRAPSVALGHQIRTVSRSRIGQRIGKLDETLMRMVEDAVANHLGLAQRLKN